MATKRQLAEKQIELQNRVIALANINIVTCGHCGSVLLHELNDKPIECASCKHELDQCDCPDLWYEGCQDNSEFDEDEPTKQISAEDVVKVAIDLKMNPSIAEINEVLKYYDSEVDQDPTATWELIVENLLYNCVVPSQTKIN